MSKAKFFALAEASDLDVEYEPKSVTHCATIDIFTRKGKLFNSSGCHTECSIQDLTDAGGIDWKEAVKSLQYIISLGFDNCDEPECDFCHPINEEHDESLEN